MYVYCEIHTSGINDIFVGINKALLYCNNYKRTLLVNGLKSAYKINFSDYFNLANKNVIFDINKINEICNNKNYTIYPEALNSKMNDILNSTITFNYSGEEGIFCYNGIKLTLPEDNRKENIIIYNECCGGNGYSLFKELIFQPHIKEICLKRYNILQKPYLCIHIRNTDYKCDYVSYFNEHEHEIRLYKEIYIATDDKKTLDFYREKGLSIQNFTTFSINDKCWNLHQSNVNPYNKFIDLFSDIYIAGMSDKLMSNSRGGFINLLRDINKNKINLKKQIL
jgi:hypothetical protein